MATAAQLHFNRRRYARRCILQALYQWQLADHDVMAIEAQFVADADFNKADAPYFHELLHRIPPQCAQLNALLQPLLGRPIEQIDPIERAILWIASYELANRTDIPYRVVINEAVALTKTFGAEQSHRFVNGVLDKLARQLRPAEK